MKQLNNKHKRGYTPHLEERATPHSTPHNNFSENAFRVVKIEISKIFRG